jgi:hypothetical protein
MKEHEASSITFSPLSMCCIIALRIQYSGDL